MPLSPCGVVMDELGRETVRYGTTHQFPIACYEDDMQTLFVPWHWHEEFECIVAVKGQVTVLLKGSRLRLEPGEGVFINSGALHAVETVEQGPSVLHSIVFHPRLIGGTTDSVFWHKLVQPLLQDRAFRYLFLSPDVAWQKEMMDRVLRAWQAAVEETEDHENFVRYQVSAAFRLLNENRPANVRKLSQQDRISAERMKRMLQFIEEHYTEELSVEQIAACVSVSASVCLRCFRNALGTTPIQYVRQLRMEKAAELLLTTDKKVSAIGLECGFSDISYFIKTFREEKGCTPKQFRGGRG